MNVQQAIADFLQHGQVVRNLSDRTLRAYQSDLSQFNLHVHDANMVDITPEQLEAYLEKLGTEPYRDTSIRRKVAALKVFFRDRKSTRLNSSHVAISYAVFCLKKKTITRKSCTKAT